MCAFITLGLLISQSAPVEQFELLKADGTVSAISFDTIPKTDWLSITHPQRLRPDWPSTSHAILANGDRIAGTLVSGDDRTVKLKSTFGEITLPLSALDCLWITEPPAEASPFPDRYSWLKSPRLQDVVLLANADTLAGDLETFSDLGNLKIKVDGMSRMIPKDRIQAIAFNPALTVNRKPKGAWYRVSLRDGSRLSCGEFTVHKDTVKLTTHFKETLAVLLKDVVCLDRHDEAMTLLDELQPGKVEKAPYLSVTWPWTANRSVKQNPLRIQTVRGVETYDRGLGTHPKTTLTYDLAGKYAAFDALVGMDAVTGRKGSAVIRIRVDDKEHPAVTLTSAETHRVRIDVTKAKTLTLVTDFGPTGDVQADVNWVNAVLLK